MEARKGYSLVGLAVLLWSYQSALMGHPNLIGSTFNDIPLVLMAFLRIALATVVLLAFKIAKKREKNGIHLPTLIKESIILGSILAVSTSFFCLGLENKNQMARFMSEGMTPIFVIMIASMIFKEERNKMFSILGSGIVIFAILGVYLVTINDMNIVSDYDYHLIYVIIGAVIWALYLNYYRKQEEKLNVTETFLTIGIFLSIFYFIINLKGNHFESIKTIDSSNLFIIGLFAIIVDVGFVLSFYKGVKIIGCNKASVVLMLSPVLTTISMAMICNLDVLRIQWIGCILVGAANVIMVSADLIREEERIYY